VQSRLTLDVLLDPFGVKPSDLLVCLPELGCLVDVDLAGLLSIRLSELLLDSQCVNSSLEDSALRGQVGGAIEAKVRSEEDLVWVKEMSVRVVAEINGSASPVNLEGVGLVRQAVERWREIVEG